MGIDGLARGRRKAGRLLSRHPVVMVAVLAILAVASGMASGRGSGAAVISNAGMPAAVRPNILLIVADDLGYSDLSVYGGEIDTPNLDDLARGGARFTQFYAAAMCSPTRAMLLTGVDHHRAGLGNLAERLADNQRGQPGYEGHLNQRVATIAEILAAEGYRTYLSGKWHLGSGEAGASQRGFDRAFALLESGAGHFANMLPLLGPGKAEYSEDGVPVEALPADFYSSRSYVDKLIGYLDEGAESNSPFFAYLSFTAPHFPLQAPRSSIEKYRGRYDAGYESILEERLNRMRAAGLIPAGTEPFPMLSSESPWEALDENERRRQARLMEIYAAMISDMDAEVGRFLAYLESRQLLDSTIIVFLSDNGAEGHYLEWGLDPLVPWAEACCDDDLEAMGSPDSYLMLGPAWARVAAAPFRMFKGFVSDGGVRVPAFVHYPGRIPAGRIVTEPASVIDLVPTLLELAGLPHPGPQFQGRDILPVQGVSLAGLVDGRTESVRGAEAALGWEIFGKRGLRQGRWKILWETADARWWDSDALGIRRGAWQLYDLESDPAETIDRAADHPERLQAMIRLWEAYAQENGVVLPDRQRGY